MDLALTLDGAIARAYGAALHAVAVADREMHVLESTRLEQLLARRCPGIDREDLFFERVTPESFAATVRQTAGADPIAIGQSFVADAVELAAADSEVRAVEAHVILRCARALGLGPFDVTSVTRELDEWIGAMS